jgi:molybdopterin converting factor small subunit
MVTITLMGQLQTADGEHNLVCELSEPATVRRVLQRQGSAVRELLQLMKEKKVMVTVNQRVASEDTVVRDGDTIKLVAHDGMGGSGVAS